MTGAKVLKNLITLINKKKGKIVRVELKIDISKFGIFDESEILDFLLNNNINFYKQKESHYMILILYPEEEK